MTTTSSDNTFETKIVLLGETGNIGFCCLLFVFVCVLNLFIKVLVRLL